jgi:type IV pilus assembly protein PilC
MGSYHYEAIKSNGETVTGKIEADSEPGVVERLRSMGLMAVDIKPVKPSPFSTSFKVGSGSVKRGDLSLFSRQLSAMLNSGIPLTRALFTLSRQVTSKTLSAALSEIARNVEGGSSFGQALKSYPKIFSPIYISMVEAGETGGTLERTLNRLSLQLQKDKELLDNIRSATFYPIAVLGFAVIILFAMLFFLVPIFVGFFPEGAELPAPTRIIIGASDLLKSFWFIIIPLIILIIIGFRAYAVSSEGKKRLDRLKFRLPVFGSLIQKSVVASFSRTFSTLISSGIPVVQALGIAGKASGNTLVIEATEIAGIRIQEGSNVSTPLEESGVFPPMVTHMISVGEETGEISEMLDKVAEFFEEEVSTMTKGLTALIEPLMLVVIGVLVGGMLIALYLPIFTVITQI